MLSAPRPAPDWAPTPLTPEVSFERDPTAVYRLFDVDDNLLYVGYTANPTSRMAMHARQQRWWRLVARRTMVWYATREEAAVAEFLAIQTEGPRFNKNRRPPRGRAALTFPGHAIGFMQPRVEHDGVPANTEG